MALDSKVSLEEVKTWVVPEEEMAQFLGAADLIDLDAYYEYKQTIKESEGEE